MPTITTMPTAVTEQPKMPALGKKRKSSDNGQTEETQQPVETKRPVIYPEERAEVCCGANALTEADAETILDWRNEAQHQALMMRKMPGSEAGRWVYGENYMLRDAEKNKVRCYNNLDNRPFDETWCNGLVQTILKFQWAGKITIQDVIQYVYGKPGMEPFTTPDGRVYNVGDLIEMSAGTINGSSIAVSCTGRVESGQHTLCALKLACQYYRQAPKGTFPQWDEYLAKHGHLHNFGANGPAPVIETILVTGLSEDRRVLMTVDNCKPRSELDVFYTSDIFISMRDYPGKRKELSRMLAACVDLFWKRSGRKGYKTHSEVMLMVESHPKLVKAVEHLFSENADRKTKDGVLVGGNLISNLGLSAGQAACLCYLMGASASDGDEYRNGLPAPREKGLDWSRWGKAKEFWALIGSSEAFAPVRQALTTETVKVGHMVIPITGTLAHATRLCILARAWHVFVTERQQFTALDLTEGGCLHLRYSPASAEEITLKDGETKVVEKPAELLEDAADFGGIDVPGKEDVEGETKPKTREELETQKEEIRRQREQEANDRVRQMRLGQDATPIAPGRKK